MDRRNQSIPLLYVRGNHYDCGYYVGQTFSSLINSFVNKSKLLNDYFLPVYNSSEGRKVYDETLNLVENRFPQYIQEIKGIADGAQVDFYKLVLFHFDEVLPNVTNQRKEDIEPNGCSTIYLKNENEHILGHTEDASGECLNSFYLINAHIISDETFGKFNFKEEKFTSLCYPGHLGGYTMSYNHHGLISTINTLVARKLLASKTPRHFIARALLAAENYDQVIEILKDSGVGIADGFSLNIIFIGKENKSNFYNIEISPAINNESQLSVQMYEKNESMIHCNHYLRLDIPEYNDYYSSATKARYETLKKYSEPKNKRDVMMMLGDTSHEEHWIFRCKPDLPIQTICVGIFDFVERTWCLYKNNPNSGLPVAKLFLDIN